MDTQSIYVFVTSFAIFYTPVIFSLYSELFVMFKTRRIILFFREIEVLNVSNWVHTIERPDLYSLKRPHCDERINAALSYSNEFLTIPIHQNLK